MKSFFTYCILLFLFNKFFFLPQNHKLNFQHLSINEGLSEINARCIIQDSFGFLWIGTQDGLNRYDGYEFVVYKHDPLDPGSISGNYINCLLEDKDKILWIGTSSGLSSFDPATMNAAMGKMLLRLILPLSRILFLWISK